MPLHNPVGPVIGTATNDNAAAGRVGETVTGSVAIGSPTSLSNNTAVNLVTISLTAGDWDVSGKVTFLANAATTISYLQAAINTTSATLPNAEVTTRSDTGAFAAGSFSGNALSLPVSTGRISLSATTNVYLIVVGGFAVNTLSVCGQIIARRVR